MRSRNRTKQRGVALITTIWLALFLALTAATVLTATRTRSAAQNNAADLLIAREAASAGVHIALDDLARSAAERAFRRDGTVRAVLAGGARVEIAIRDERGKLDLRQSPRHHLAALLKDLGGRAGGIDAFDAVNLADRIGALLARDRLGPGNLAGLGGLPGMTPDLLASIARHATVFGFGPRINPETASREALRAVGVDRRTTEEILAWRVHGGPRPSAGSAETWLTTEEGPVYTVTVTARLENGMTGGVTAVVVNEGIGFGAGSARFSIVELQ